MILLAAAALALPTPCRLPAGDRVWLERALGNWRVAERRLLRLDPVPLPTVVAIGADCVVTAPRGERLGRAGIRHDGTATLPGGRRVAVGPLAFAGPNAVGGFFVIATPAVWERAGITSELGLTGLLDIVLLHELMHSRQFGFVNPEMERLTRRYGLPEDINDDSLQDAFKGDAAYVAAWERERDLLFAAAAAPSDGEARRLAGEALQAMRARRAGWFVGAAAKWAPLDDLFLQMEGLGQWLQYRWLVDAAHPAVAPAVALDAVRRKRSWWSQDEGLGLMLVVDRLVPGWQKEAFADRPALAGALLARAAGGATP